MKIINIKTIATAILLSAIVFTGCKKDEKGPAGPQGPQGEQGPVVTLTNAGFISGNITGTRKDGTPFNEAFNYTYYFPGSTSSGSMDSVSINSYNFSISRSTNDIFANNNAIINIQTNSKTASTGTLSLNMYFEKVLGNNKVFMFSSGSTNETATSLSYNTSTGLFSGNFNITVPGSNNSTGNSAIISGSFQATMVQLVYIKKLESGISQF